MTIIARVKQGNNVSFQSQIKKKKIFFLLKTKPIFGKTDKNVIYIYIYRLVTDLASPAPFIYLFTYLLLLYNIACLIRLSILHSS